VPTKLASVAKTTNFSTPVLSQLAVASVQQIVGGVKLANCGGFIAVKPITKYTELISFYCRQIVTFSILEGH